MGFHPSDEALSGWGEKMTSLDQLWAAGLIDSTVDPRAAVGGVMWPPTTEIEVRASERGEADADFVLSTNGLSR